MIDEDDYPRIEPVHSSFPHLDDWTAFTLSTITSDRFGKSDESERLIRKVQLACIDHWTWTIEKGTMLFRARRHPLHRNYPKNSLVMFAGSWPLSDEEIGAPPSQFATPGRANPDGIPYLYLSDDARTVVAEVRPWLNAEITVAKFAVDQDLKIADLRPSPQELRKESSDTTAKSQSLRRAIGDSFATPLHPDHEIGYSPTQLIAESIKLCGFDGIAYPSAMRYKGWNLALFNPNLAKPVSKEVWVVRKILYESDIVPSSSEA